MYAAIGVGEYFLYDPTSDYLRPALVGYRFVGGAYRAIEPNERGQLESERLKITLELHDGELVLRDSKTAQVLLTSEEAAEQRGLVAHRRSQEAEQRSQEAIRRSREAEQRSQQVKRQLDATLAENAALAAELARLRRQLDEQTGK